MARVARVVVPEIPHHITQSGVRSMMEHVMEHGDGAWSIGTKYLLLTKKEQIRDFFEDKLKEIG